MTPPHEPDREMSAPNFTGLHYMGPQWTSFVQRHQSWVGRFPGQPHYALPAEVIECLTRSITSADSEHRGQRPLLSPEDATAERDLLALCRTWGGHTIGCWGNGSPINHNLLADPMPPEHFSADEAQKLGLPPNINEQITEACHQTEGLKRHLLAYVGFLTFRCREYQTERDGLQRQWLNLSANEQTLVQFPLLNQWCPVPGEDQRGATCPPPPAVSAFWSEAGSFLRRWELSQLITWDLPLPQGPLQGLPLGVQIRVLGPDHVVSTQPSYLSIPSNWNLREQVAQQQNLQGQMLGVSGDRPVAGLSGRGADPATEATAFQWWHIENTIRTRYGPLHGLVARLKDAFTRMTERSTERFGQIRDLYRPFLRSGSES